MPHQPVLIVVSCGFFGFFAFALMPVCLEVGVECTYPVAEATSAGLQWMAGYVVDDVVRSLFFSYIKATGKPGKINKKNLALKRTL